MKKLILSVCIALILATTGIFALMDYNKGGWISSNGLDYLPGVAFQVKIIDGGYSFTCLQIQSWCYQINGDYLWINDGGFSPEGEEEGEYVEVLRN